MYCVLHPHNLFIIEELQKLWPQAFSIALNGCQQPANRNIHIILEQLAAIDGCHSFR